MRNQRRIADASLLLAISGLVLVAAFPPGPHTWYPPCPIYRWFGILCPGCGATRAISALLRGNLREAVHQNALAVLLSPIAGALALQSYRQVLRGQVFQWPRMPAAATATLTTAALVFSILRNIH